MMSEFYTLRKRFERHRNQRRPGLAYSGTPRHAPSPDRKLNRECVWRARGKM